MAIGEDGYRDSLDQAGLGHLFSHAVRHIFMHLGWNLFRAGDKGINC